MNYKIHVIEVINDEQNILNTLLVKPENYIAVRKGQSHSVDNIEFHLQKKSNV